jgi:hypothetical protein
MSLHISSVSAPTQDVCLPVFGHVHGYDRATADTNAILRIFDCSTDVHGDIRTLLRDAYSDIARTTREEIRPQDE